MSIPSLLSSSREVLHDIIWSGSPTAGNLINNKNQQLYNMRLDGYATVPKITDNRHVILLQMQSDHPSMEVRTSMLRLLTGAERRVSRIGLMRSL